MSGGWSRIILPHSSMNRFRVQRADAGDPPGRFNAAPSMSFVFGEFMGVPEEGLVDTGASGTGVIATANS